MAMWWKWPRLCRNYLIPQGVAVLATKGAIKQAEFRKEKERQRLLAEKQEAETRKTAIEKLSPYSIPKQVGENEAFSVLSPVKMWLRLF